MSAAAELTKAEQETILLTSEADNTVSVYTFNRKLKRRLSEYSQKYPELCRLVKEQQNGGVTYEIDKRRLVLRLSPPPSEKAQQASRANLLLTGRAESNLS
jgi:hypothetical protein